jgi:EmrB/QacA subfamily drug resistance transporter
MPGLVSQGRPPSPRLRGPRLGVRSRPAAGHAARRAVRPGPALAAIATAQFMVALDTTIVNVALPHIQLALGFSDAGLEWVVNAYAVTFGGVLLIGGRAGDLLGRRRVFALGLLVFSAASLAGGLAASPAWLLAARALQDAGAAVTAPAALALVATTFPEGGPRNRAMGVYSATTAVGGAIGLLAGGLLTTYASWRWVLYVNVPIGLVVAAAAPLVLAEAPRVRGRFDLPGAITGTGGVAALVYGLSAAAASSDGASHWTEPKVVAALSAAVLLLAAFVAIQAASRQPLVPGRLLRDRSRSGAYLIMLCAATAMAAVFFFLTLFQETVWHFSALQTGLSYLPMTTAVLAASAVSARLVTRVPTRLLMLTAAATATAGLFWLSRLGEHGGYVGTVLGPTVVTGCGLGLLFVPLTLTALSRVGESDSGAASSLLSTGQQVGGAIGLAVLGTAAWAVAAGQARSAGYPALSPRLPPDVYHHALTTGFGHAFLAAAGIMLAALVVAATVIRADVRRPATPVANPASAAATPSGTATDTATVPAFAPTEHRVARAARKPAARKPAARHAGRVAPSVNAHPAAKAGLAANAWPAADAGYEADDGYEADAGHEPDDGHATDARYAGNASYDLNDGYEADADPNPNPSHAAHADGGRNAGYAVGRHRAPRRALMSTRHPRRTDASPR